MKTFSIVILLFASLFIAVSCGDDDEKDELATVVTNAASTITSTTAVSGGAVNSDGSADVTARGVCWDTTHNPTTAHSKTTDGTGTGSFVSNITGLTANKTYYVRAYATNSVGTAYGNEVNFTTIAGIPIVTTASISAITHSSASCGGIVTSDGGSPVTGRGVCWSISQNPTTANSKTTDATGTGSFTSSITGLSANTTYYVKAYATNSEGTAYGNEMNFTTTAGTTQIASIWVWYYNDDDDYEMEIGGFVLADPWPSINNVLINGSTPSDLWIGTDNDWGFAPGFQAYYTYHIPSVNIQLETSVGTISGSISSPEPFNSISVTNENAINIGQSWTMTWSGGNYDFIVIDAEYEYGDDEYLDLDTIITNGTQFRIPGSLLQHNGWLYVEAPLLVKGPHPGASGNMSGDGTGFLRYFYVNGDYYDIRVGTGLSKEKSASHQKKDKKERRKQLIEKYFKN